MLVVAVNGMCQGVPAGGVWTTATVAGDVGAAAGRTCIGFRLTILCGSYWMVYDWPSLSMISPNVHGCPLLWDDGFTRRFRLVATSVRFLNGVQGDFGFCTFLVDFFDNYFRVDKFGLL